MECFLERSERASDETFIYLVFFALILIHISEKIAYVLLGKGNI